MEALARELLPVDNILIDHQGCVNISHLGGGIYALLGMGR